MKEVFYNDGKEVVRRSLKSDSEYLSKHLRQCDIDEVWASHNVTPKEALDSGFEKSVFCLTVENGNPIAMFGINPKSILGQEAVVWFLASDDLERIQYKFLKYSRKFIKMMLDFYPYLDNYVDDRNTKSIKWLKMCGATVEEPAPYGIEKKLFRYFYFKRGDKDV